MEPLLRYGISFKKFFSILTLSLKEFKYFPHGLCERENENVPIMGNSINLSNPVVKIDWTDVMKISRGMSVWANSV